MKQICKAACRTNSKNYAPFLVEHCNNAMALNITWKKCINIGTILTCMIFSSMIKHSALNQHFKIPHSSITHVCILPSEVSKRLSCKSRTNFLKYNISHLSKMSSNKYFSTTCYFLFYAKGCLLKPYIKLHVNEWCSLSLHEMNIFDMTLDPHFKMINTKYWRLIFIHSVEFHINYWLMKALQSLSMFSY